MVTTLASARAITSNLVMMGLGTGLLTMPWGVAGASIVNSLLILALVLVMNAWTVMILIRACDENSVFDLGALLSRLPGQLGPRLQLIGDGIVWGSQALVLIGYTIVIRDSIFELQPADQVLLSKPVLTVLVAFVVCPLSFLDQAYLSFTSTLGIIANVYLIALLVFYVVNLDELPPEVRAPDGDRLCLLGFSDGVVTMFSLMMYTIIIQMAMPPMYEELEGRTPEKFFRCLIIAFIILFFIFAAVMISGYIAFGSGVGSSVLDSLPTNTFGTLARFGMAVCILGCYPLNVKPMVAPFLRENNAIDTADTNKPLLGEKTERVSGVVPTVAIVAASTVASFWLTSLGPLNAINGAIQVAGYVGLMPGMTGLYLSKDVSKISMYLLMCFSLIASILGFIFTDNDKDALNAACQISWTAS
jgi:amino acid permease